MILTRTRRCSTIRAAAHWLLCSALVSSCASRNTPITAEQRQQLGRVYLHSAGATGETFFHAGFARGGTIGALSGAGKGALKGLDECVNNSLSSGQLGVIVFLFCAPLAVPGNMLSASKAGSVADVPAEKLAELEQHSNDVLQQADLSPALVAALDELSQKIHTLEPYDISHGILPDPDSSRHETISSVAARWDYQTVIDIQVTEAGFESDKGVVPLMHFSMVAHVTLIDTRTGKTLQEQDYPYASKPQPYEFWFSDNHASLFREIAQANQVLASNIIENVFTR